MPAASQRIQSLIRDRVRESGSFHIDAYTQFDGVLTRSLDDVRLDQLSATHGLEGEGTHAKRPHFVNGEGEPLYRSGGYQYKMLNAVKRSQELAKLIASSRPCANVRHL